MSVEKTKQKAAEVESGNRGSTQGSVSNDARIIRKTLKDKLEGWVRGELLGVQGQVKQLIHEAKSPQNLSLLYEGWGAWY
jgi:phosphatidylinositol kinase/protein kinase (PI-3  family)